MAPHLSPLCLGLLLLAVVDVRAISRFRRAADGAGNGLCNDLPAPQNGQVKCEDTGFEFTCTATCNAGYQFETHKTSVPLNCDQFSGDWYDGQTFPKCIAVCTPACMNGGTCQGGGTCSCPPGYTGSRCQHAMAGTRCLDPPAPMFGNIVCTPDNSTGAGGRVCTVTCNVAYQFQQQPADAYRCDQQGNWSPAKDTIPKCIPASTPAPIQPLQPTGGSVNPTLQGGAMCVVWSQDHYRTFDSKIYTFQGSCQYLLAKDCQFNTYAIHVINDNFCQPGTRCKRQLDIYLGDSDKVELRQGGSGMTVTWNGEKVSVPSVRDRVVFEQTGAYLNIRTNMGFQVRWDGHESVFVKVSEDQKGRTCGLCGVYDGNPDNDFTTQAGKQVTSVASFAMSWKKSMLGGTPCPDAVQKSCQTDTPENTQRTTNARQHCSQLQTDSAFQLCHSNVDPAPYISACESDCCSADSGNCMCNTFEAYSRACMNAGVKLAWRKTDRCPVSCSGGMVYQECGSSCQKKCSATATICQDSSCVDGCFCPPDRVLHDGKCITADECPCTYGGKDYKEDDTIKKECNTCACKSGKWQCTTKKCEATCSAIGDPHYMTFDGKRYNFMGTCSYYMIYDPSFDVIVDNIQCGQGELATCTKSVTIDVNGMTIKLDHNHQLFVNGKEVTMLPYIVPGIKIFMVSSLFMQAELENGVKILWDGRTRAYITVPPSFRDKTRGLCGTFDGNQNNDFLTRQGDIETNENAFGNKWKTVASCRDVPIDQVGHPCELNAQRKAMAQQACDNLKGDVFKGCHDVVSVDSYYENCLYDICACTDNLKDCMCPNLGEYADMCAAQGVPINWRLKITECMLTCTGGQEYQVCGNPCTRTCRNIAEGPGTCQERCVEGCNCPHGQALNDDGECVAISQCPCIFGDGTYPTGYTALRGNELCVCENAQFNCTKLTGDGTNPKRIKNICGDTKEYTTCVSACPVTCDNMHDPPTCTTSACKEGCVCKPGYVLEGDKCVPKDMCPCHHGGKAYYEGETISKDCNQCTCKSRRWECEDKDCPAICSAYGDSHFQTFDGRRYEFQGNCQYTLVRSEPGSATPFVLTTENMACGTSGVTCTKAIEFTVGEPGSTSYYRLSLVRGKPVRPEPGSPFKVTEVGSFVNVETPYGITLQWDKGTTLYIKLTTDLRGMVSGLCGNFNGDQVDDFSMPGGGPPAVKATTFGDSWKILDYCPPSTEIIDTCTKESHRKPWAQQRCGVLASELFQPCHHLVAYEDFMKRCIFDACACDLGGDCECLCTAIAAYAHECAVKGIPIKWRSNDICPIECLECQTFNPCVSPCPKKSCDNRLTYEKDTKVCRSQSCVEGCDSKPCPPDQVLSSNGTHASCIPESLCETPACVLGGQNYREGQRIDDERFCRPDCEICYCEGGQVKRMTHGTCKQTLAPTVTPTAAPTVSPTQPGLVTRTTLAPECLKDGWTSWMSGGSPTPTNLGDHESTQELRSLYTFCADHQMTAIECRVIGQNTKVEDSGQAATCDLLNGLVCRHKDQNKGVMCYDYEVRFFCDCALTPIPSINGLPTASPGVGTNGNPTASPGVGPNGNPTASPEVGPNGNPTSSPGAGNSGNPTASPGAGTNGNPTASPGAGTNGNPTASPGAGTNGNPTASPGAGTNGNPTASPGAGTNGNPTASPGAGTNGNPTASPGAGTNGNPTASPGAGTNGNPTASPGAGNSGNPTASPGVGTNGNPTASPGAGSNGNPTASPGAGTNGNPTASPGAGINGNPTASPGAGSNGNPTASPGAGTNGNPTASPGAGINGNPTASPGAGTNGNPTASPGAGTNGNPTASPKVGPNGNPTASPGAGTNGNPTASPGAGNSGNPSASPGVGSNGNPTASPGAATNGNPTASPGAGTNGNPTASPGVGANGNPTASPGFGTNGNPTASPGAGNGGNPSASPGVGINGNPTPSPSAGGQGQPRLTTVPSGHRTPVPPVCYEGWSEWMSVDTPTDSHPYEGGAPGDYEMLVELRMYHGFCASPTSISCRSLATGQPYHLVGDTGVSCDLKNGLMCKNSDQTSGRCQDYEVRVNCDCGGTGEVPTATPTAQPTMEPTKGTPFAPVPSCGWTKWMDSSKPRSLLSPKGETESFGRLRLAYAFCQQPTEIECRVKPTASMPDGVPFEKSGQMAVTCDLNRGLVCQDSLQTGGQTCYDYEVRVYCTDYCMSTASPQPGNNGVPTASPGAGTNGNPSASPGVGPSGNPTASPEAGTNGNPTASPGAGTNGNPTASPAAGTNGNPSASPGVGPNGNPTASPGAGTNGNPTASPGVGPNGNPTASPEAGTNGNPTASPGAGTNGNPTASPGVVPNGNPTASPGAGTNGNPTASPGAGTNGNPSASPGVGPNGNPTASPGAGNNGNPTASPGAGNNGNPTASPGAGNNGNPTASPGAGNNGNPTASPGAGTNGNPTASPGVGANGNPTASPGVSPNGNPTASPDTGAQGLPTATAPVVGSTVRVTDSTIYIVTDKICDVPMGIAKSGDAGRDQFSASTSYDHTTEAAEGRLGNRVSASSAGAWIPRFQDKNQWFQVDMKVPEFISGLVLQGSPDKKYWVSSYALSTSLDGQTFTPYTDKGKTEARVFIGNVDQTTPTRGMFDREILARYVRIQPLTWNNMIALRVEILSCYGGSSPAPSLGPNGLPTASPGAGNSGNPTASPGAGNNGNPTASPGAGTNGNPTASPGVGSNGNPTASPGAGNNGNPTASPGAGTNGNPTASPGVGSNGNPTASPGAGNNGNPTASPGAGTNGNPTASPGVGSNGNPTASPGAGNNGNPTASPGPGNNGNPTASPGAGTNGNPTASPGAGNNGNPTASPGAGTNGNPTASPGVGSNGNPTASPGAGTNGNPTASPGAGNNGNPTASPGAGTNGNPTASPGAGANGNPTASPGVGPNGNPSASPGTGTNGNPTASPGVGPNGNPTASPGAGTDGNPTASPGVGPNGNPSASPGMGTNGNPTASPGAGTNGNPTASPGAGNSGNPTASPGAGNSGNPTASPGVGPNGNPTASPGAGSNGNPSASPGAGNQGLPTASPGVVPGGTPALVCGTPMGVDNAISVTDAQLTSSGFSGSNSVAPAGRLYNEFGAWRPKTVDSHQWIQVDFLTPQRVSGMLIQGGGQTDQWVSSYMITTSLDGFSFMPYSETPDGKPKVFTGNSDHNTVVKQVFAHEFEARYVRIVPVTWATAGIALRFNVLGCYLATVAPTALGHGLPTASPGAGTNGNPTASPGVGINGNPTASPGAGTNGNPSASPGVGPNGNPTASPGAGNNGNPTASPGVGSNGNPTASPGAGTNGNPSASPGVGTNGNPTASPGAGNNGNPTASPAAGTNGNPTASPGVGANGNPTASPGAGTNGNPSASPGVGNNGNPSASPGVGTNGNPTASPGVGPNGNPTASPGAGTNGNPSASPGVGPNGNPTASPGAGNNGNPTASPGAGTNGNPTASPGVGPNGNPTASPGAGTNGNPSASPGVGSNGNPTASPGAGNNGNPTASPGVGPNGNPSASPFPGVTGHPTLAPMASLQGLPTPAPGRTSTLEPVCFEPMGVDNYRIIGDKQLTVSSSLDSNHGASQARLFPHSAQHSGSWQPRDNDTAPWVQVDFLEAKMVSGVVTQGSMTSDRWVTSYQVHYSLDGKNFTEYRDSEVGLARVFQGNTDSSTAVTEIFNRQIIARYLRIVPVDQHGGVAIRFNVIGCNPSAPNQPTASPIPGGQGLPTVSPNPDQHGNPTASPGPDSQITPATVCLTPMGVENGYIVMDRQLTASTSLSSMHGAKESRIFNTNSSLSSGAWAPKDGDAKPYVQVDFLTPKLVSGIVTQGSPNQPRWTESYYVYTSLDGQSFTPYTALPGDNIPVLFSGNTDQNTVQRQLFNRDITARYVRVVPVKAGPSGYSLRFNVLGCNPDLPKPPFQNQGLLTAAPGTDNNGNPTASPGVDNNGQPTASPGVGNNGLPTASPKPGQHNLPGRVCDVPMGLENPAIIGGRQFRASSQLDDFHGAERARLYTQKDGPYAGGWVPATSDQKQWIEVDFLAPYEIGGVSTQGRSDSPHWVTSFEVFYSNDGRSFLPITEAGDKKAKVFVGNYDQSSPRMNLFPDVVSARYIRIRPLTWHDAIGLRFTVRGCLSPSATSSATMRPTATPTAQPTVSPTQGATTQACLYWTPWVNANKPSDMGEFETYWDVQSHVKVCDQKFVTNFECRRASDKVLFSGEAGVLCDKASFSLSCMDASCPDYEIRVFCDECGKATPSPSPSVNKNPTAEPKCTDNVWSEWINKDKPDTGDGDKEMLTEEELKKFCPLGKLTQVECETSSGEPYYSTTAMVTCDRQTGLECLTDMNAPLPCPDFRIRYLCECASGIPTLPPQTTRAPSTSCVQSGWSQWINKDSPDSGKGDFEKMTEQEKSAFCSGGNITKVECKTTDDIPSYSTGEIVECNPEIGLACSNDDNAPMPCSDYAIRYYCQCAPTPSPGVSGSGNPTASPGPNGSGNPTASPGPNGSGNPTASPGPNGSGNPTASPGPNGSGNPTASPGPNGSGNPTASPGPNGSGNPTASPGPNGSGNPTASPGPNGSGQPTAQPSSRCVETKWSAWLNRDSPDTGDVDKEFMTPLELTKFCPDGKVTKVECQTATGIPSYSSGAVLTCDLAQGLICSNEENFPIPCDDFQIRYFCFCENPTASPSAGNQGLPSASPGFGPDGNPTASPGVASNGNPTASPGAGNSGNPTASPGVGSNGNPTASPGAGTNGNPTASPGAGTNGNPTASPGVGPNGNPTASPGAGTNGNPSASPGVGPNGNPTASPGVGANGNPSASPGVGSNGNPTVSPGAGTNGNPSPSPGVGSNGNPTASPGAGINGNPTASPGVGPNGNPSASPGVGPGGNPTPVVRSCAKSHWSPWVNRDNPGVGDGDREKLTPTEIEAFCQGGKVTKIECYTSDIPYYSSGEIVTCDLPHGFECRNEDNFPMECNDYKVRYFCECEETVTPTQEMKTPPPRTFTTCDWSGWLNADQPTEGVGDLETIDKLKSIYGLCKTIDSIECRIAGTDTKSSASGQAHVTCDVNNGLRCYNQDQSGGQCYDYEVRVLCWSPECQGVKPTAGPTAGPTVSPSRSALVLQTTAICAPGTVWDACAYKCDELCDYMSRDSGLCDNGVPTQCVPGCKSPMTLCKPGEKRLDRQTCVKEEFCTCLKPDGTPAKPLEVWPKPDHPCSSCHCFKNTVLCSKEECPSTTSPNPSATPTAGPTAQPTPHPDCHWTGWINIDSPQTGEGDLETLDSIRRRHQFCQNPVKIECRDVSNGKMAVLSGQDLVCDVSLGLKCLNWDNSDGCHDYEVRFYCPCFTTASPVPGGNGNPTASPGSNSNGLPTASPGVGVGGNPTASPGAGTNGNPTASPGVGANGNPTASPVAGTNGNPTASPGAGNNGNPTASPGVGANGNPTASPGAGTNGNPTASPGAGNSGNPTASPGAGTNGNPTASPGAGNNGNPTASPGAGTNGNPTASPGAGNSGNPTASPGAGNSGNPTASPGAGTNGNPTASPGAGTNGNPTASPGAGTNGNPTASPGAGTNGNPTASPGAGTNGNPTASPGAGTNGNPTASPGAGNNGNPTASPGPGQGGVPTASPLACGWTEWMSGSKPDQTGEQEHIKELRAIKKFCDTEDITAIECRDKETKSVAEALGQMVTCDLSMSGLTCLNDDQFDLQCKDYEVRFLCEPKSLNCNGVPTASPGAGNQGNPTASPGAGNQGNPSASPSSGNQGQPTASPGPIVEGTPTASPAPTAKACGMTMNETDEIPVPLGQLYASSSLSAYTGAERSRLTTAANGVYSGAWLPTVSNSEQWLEARLPGPHQVAGVITGGRPGYPQYVTGYTLMYSNDGNVYHYIEERPGVPKVFQGNSDSSSSVTRVFTPVTASFFRIVPQTWQGAIALRFGLLGCRSSALPTAIPTAQPTASPTKGVPCVDGWTDWINKDSPDSGEGDREQVTGSERSALCPGGSLQKIECATVDSISSDSSGEILTCNLNHGLECKNDDNFPIPCSDYKIRYQCQCGTATGAPSVGPNGVPTASPGVNAQGSPTPAPVTAPTAQPTRSVPAGCREEMGVQSGAIRPDMLSSSSYRDGGHGPEQARLGHSGSWLPARDENTQYLQVNFLAPRVVTGVSTQGRPDAPSWVSSYKVFFSYDGVNWSPYRVVDGVDKVFSGNSDSNTPVTNLFLTPVRAQFVRIYPVTWQGKIAMRIELHGCFSPYPTAAPIAGVQGLPTASPKPGELGLPTPSPSPSINQFPDKLKNCIEWDLWVDERHPTIGSKGDFEPIDKILAKSTCQHPLAIQCRTATPDKTPAEFAGQKVQCTLWDGLLCFNQEQTQPLCYNYEVRVGCLKQTPECAAIPTVTPTPAPTASPTPGINLEPCYAGMDNSHCPKTGCSTDQFCNGTACVPRSQCPCVINGRVVRNGDLTQNENCETCTCVSGQIRCLPKTCPDCQQGYAGLLDKATCQCTCKTCDVGQYHCSNGICIPDAARCDGVVDCTTDEIGCTSTPMFTMPTPQMPELQNKPTAAPKAGGQGNPTASPGPDNGATPPHTSPYLPDEHHGRTKAHYTTTPAGPTCVDGWTDWINKDSPDSGDGDREQVTGSERSALCPGGSLQKIECATVDSISSDSSGEILTCNLNQGLECKNDDNFPIPCSDYKIRYQCQCGPGPNGHGQPTAAPTSGSGGVPTSGPAPKSGGLPTIVPTPTCEPAQCPQPQTCRPPMVSRRVDSGECCPTFTCACPPECPKPMEPPCAKGSEVVDIEVDCNCTTKACVVPKPKPTQTDEGLTPFCHYVAHHQVINGTDVALPVPVEAVYKVGATWDDGLCRHCACVNTSGKAETSCRQMTCSPCKLGEIREARPNQCCGECVQVGCVQNGTVYKAGEAIPTSRKCFKSSCIRDLFNNGHYLIQQSQIACTLTDKLQPCVDDDDHMDVTGCCMKCVPKTLLPTNSSSVCESCSPRLVYGNPQQSVGHFKVRDQGENCENFAPLGDLKECSGYCGSSSKYASLVLGFQNQCNCCQAAKTITKTVTLTCDSGRTITRTYQVPETCGCSACAGAR